MTPEELFNIGRMLAALVFVLALMGGLAFVLKKLGLSGPPGTLAGKKRLKVIESLPLDMRRRLVLIQCDDEQHLVILGPAGETLIKTGIAVRNDPPGAPASSVDASAES
ncbi:MAG: flagellar biosynthetic protein FliO [Rhodospirillales bacterium]|nr:flagellar biosynthetic protein FliO [Alphaproteobacteria bacterium]MCB1839247.1 flagellar biosynthetic protein FliO [Alphaproteobacteria bacterium]MCB9976190.1 flagellar biosynthetic protein FliO [Rhodospirillales bacterium]